MAMHPNKEVMATSQMANKEKIKGQPKMIDIYLWNAKTMECLGILNNFH